MYENLAEAESVKNNLASTITNYSITIEEVHFPKINLSFDEYDNKDVLAIKESIQFFDKVYQEIYDFSIRFDKKEINNLAISSEISALRGKLKSYMNKIQLLLNNPNAKLIVLRDSLVELDELMDTSILRTIDNTGLNYYLKNFFVSIARIKYEMFNKL